MADSPGTGAGARPIRAFVALSPPAELVEAIGRWQELALGEGLRPIGADSLHLTLAFLGDLTAGQAERAGAVVASIEPRRVSLRLAPVPVGVPAGRPRVVAFEVESPAAIALGLELGRALVEAGVHEPEDRPLWPHLSVARVRAGRGGGGSGEAAVGRLPPLDEEGLGPVNAVRVALYRSQLRTQGARYRSLAAIDLPQKAADEVI